MDKLDYLIDYLLKESGRTNLNYSNRDKKILYRALVNIRQAKPISEEFLKIEDNYLQEELKSKNITNVEDIRTIKEQYQNCNIVNTDKICLWQGDITKLKIAFAGVRLRLACNEIMKNLNYNLETGKAIITNGYNLPSKYVIQTVGPIIENKVVENKKEELANCYKNSLKLAIDNGIRTIAFPCISTGVFRFPKELASIIALKTVDELITSYKDKIDKVVFNLWSDEDVKIYEKNIK